jgi:hypothetical protein
VQIKVDVSDVHALTVAAEKSLTQKQPAGMKKILDAAAVEARQSHTYQNRTHHLEDSTFASEIDHGADDVSIEFGAREYYASFVERRGYQRVNEIAQEAETTLEYFLEGEADILGSL